MMMMMMIRAAPIIANYRYIIDGNHVADYRYRLADYR